jgi:hypothetical protein
MLKPGDEYAEGRMRFVEDVLLHESVHQYCEEALHEGEASYKGHGPVFARECNRIGAALGLPPVRLAKRRGPNKHLPNCADWPWNVRPADYYLGALADPAKSTGKPGEKPGNDDDDEDSATFRCPKKAPVKAGRVITTHYEGDELMTLVDTIHKVTGLRRAVGKQPSPSENGTGLLPKFRKRVGDSYRRLSRRFHPDAGGSNGDMIVVNECFDSIRAIIDRLEKEAP